MLAAHKNVRILVSLLKQYNIRHIVLSPGSRNMSIAKSVEDDPFFTCYSIVDERSAAYFAVGLSLEVGAPVAISCTSAQASRNYIPGMTEAFYRKAPVLAITADYDKSFIGQQNMQALVQTSIPVDAAKVSVDLGIIKDAMDEQLVVRNANLLPPVRKWVAMGTKVVIPSSFTWPILAEGLLFRRSSTLSPSVKLSKPTTIVRSFKTPSADALARLSPTGNSVSIAVPSSSIILGKA